jgi:hypothetical protein
VDAPGNNWIKYLDSSVVWQVGYDFKTVFYQVDYNKSVKISLLLTENLLTESRRECLN